MFQYRQVLVRLRAGGSDLDRRGHRSGRHNWPRRSLAVGRVSGAAGNKTSKFFTAADTALQ